MRRAAASIAAAALAAAIPRAQQEPVRAFVEVTADRNSYFVGQAMRIRLRFGVETEFLRNNLIQPFRQKLDVPVRVDAPFFTTPTGASPRQTEGNDPRNRQTPQVTFVLNEQLSRAERDADVVIDGRSFTTAEITRTFFADRRGEIAIGTPRLRYSYASSFREDFFGDRVPSDKKQAALTGEEVSILGRPLPLEGRPANFTGAVGHYSIAATADRHAVRGDETVKLRLVIDGDGDPRSFDAPSLGELDRYHLLGHVDNVDGSRRAITYDIAPLDDTVTEVPPIGFAFFDPTTARYDIAQTEPIALDVRGVRAAPVAEPEAAPEPRTGPGYDDIHGIAIAAPAGGTTRASEPSNAALLAGLIAPWLVFCGVGGLRLRRTRRLATAELRRARLAARVFRARTDAGHDVADSFVEFLAARMRCAAPMVVAPELPARLAAAGVTEASASLAAALLDTVRAARYGGERSYDGAERVRQVVDQLEAEFAAAEQQR